MIYKVAISNELKELIGVQISVDIMYDNFPFNEDEKLETITFYCEGENPDAIWMTTIIGEYDTRDGSYIRKT